MSESHNNDQMSISDVFYLVLGVFVLLFITLTVDSCHAGWRYRDLRDRLERLEQKQ